MKEAAASGRLAARGRARPGRRRGDPRHGARPARHRPRQPGRRGVRMDVVVLQHIACEPPGEYEAVLRERGAGSHRVELDEGEPLPDWREFDAIVAMGGPMSVNDDAELPWLTAEKRPIGEAVRAGRAVLRRLPRRAAAGGEPRRARLRRARARGRRAARDAHGRGRRRPALRRPAAASSRRCSGTATRSTCPRGATLLASSPAFPNQAFRYGEPPYGIQFHVEVLPEMAREWAHVPGVRRTMPTASWARAGWGGCWPTSTPPRRAMRATGRDMFARWAELAVPVAR